MDKRLHPDTFIRLYRSVVSNAAVWEGEPIIAGTQILASTLVELIKSGDVKEVVATNFGISTEQVMDAVRYYKKIKNPIRDKEMFRKFTSNVSD